MGIQPGTVVAEAYRADRCLGHGGMGEVWAGVRLSDGEPVALKILLAAEIVRQQVEPRFKREFQSRFRREARVLSRVQSPYIARVLDFTAEPQLGLVIILELVPGPSLEAVLTQQKTLSVIQALDIGADICCGLRDLHAVHVVHRDLKPGNIILRPDGPGRQRGTLIDFGLSRVLDEDATVITQHDTVLGTLEYIAPEQIAASRNATPAADIYSLGATLYRALTGQHVFGKVSGGALALTKLKSEPTPLRLAGNSAVAARMEALVNHLLARNPRNRPSSAAEVLADIDAIRTMIREQGEPPLRPVEPDDDEVPTVFAPPKRRGHEHALSLPDEHAEQGRPKEVVGQRPRSSIPPPPPPTPVANHGPSQANNAGAAQPALLSRPLVSPARAIALILVIIGGGLLGWILSAWFVKGPA